MINDSTDVKDKEFSCYCSRDQKRSEKQAYSSLEGKVKEIGIYDTSWLTPVLRSPINLAIYSF